MFPGALRMERKRAYNLFVFLTSLHKSSEKKASTTTDIFHSTVLTLLERRNNSGSR